MFDLTVLCLNLVAVSNRVDRISAVIQTVALFQFFINKGEVN